MANEFKVRKGLIVQGSGSTGDETLLDVQGNQGQLFSVTDSLIGDIFTVSDISGIPILNVSSSGIVEAGTFGNYGLIVNGTNITSSGNISASGNLLVTNITASGEISASGDVLAANLVLVDGFSADLGNIHINTTTFPNGIYTNNTGSFIATPTDVFVGASNPGPSQVTIATQGHSNTLKIFKGNITASGDISASGDLYANKLIVKPGTQSEPSIIFNKSDTDTGIFSPGPNILSFQVGGGNVEMTLTTSPDQISTTANLSVGSTVLERHITASGNMNLGGGKITLEGTGQILGVDTVSNGTDAANKTYVDNAVSGLAGGTVTGVSGTAPVSVTTSTTAPIVSMAAATTSVSGYLTSTAFTTFNNKTSNTGTVTSVAATFSNPDALDVTVTNSTTAASLAFDFAGSSTQYINGEGDLITFPTVGGGTVTGVTGTSPVSVTTSTTAPVVSMAAASTGTSGYLTSANWNTFNGKANITGTTAKGILTLNSSAPNGIASAAVTLGDDGQSTNRNVMTFNRYSGIVFDSTLTSTGNSSGILMKRGSTTTVQGYVYYYTSTEIWAPAINTFAVKATGLLAFALDNSSTGDGMMLSGFVFKASHGFTVGAPIYLSSSAGVMTNTVPTSGWARVVGYAVGENTIYFSPDRTWVEIAN
tara:strand:+ start:382 stop:2331 length:1950 start_codon:yes stop_codon:yes gene_type:complete